MADRRPKPALGPGRKPVWLRHRPPAPRQYRATGALLGALDLRTVCEEARCPNKGECFGSGTATFLILGDTCTRSCRFCAVEHAGPAAIAAEPSALAPEGGPAAAPGGGSAAVTSARSAAGVCLIDEAEPARVAAAAARLGLRHVVVTSVTRDDLPDGGAAHFAATVAAVREAAPAATVEVLIPDLGGDEAALRAVLAARPDVLGHNLETVPRLYPQVRPQAGYERSLALLRRAAEWARAEANEVATSASGARRAAEVTSPAAGAPAAGERDAELSTRPPRPLVKTGLMVGLGETAAEVDGVLRDAADAGVDLVTIGQYLQARRDCLPVVRYVEPAEFVAWQRRGPEFGLSVTAAPFVRSSYRAGEALHGTGGHRAEGDS